MTMQVPEGAQKATKAIAATVTTLAGFAAIVVQAVADGQLTGSEVGSAVTAAVTAIAAIVAVWRVPNRTRKPSH